jgi:putative tryptophan/tyrosine transport system substrate-binding protein
MAISSDPVKRGLVTSLARPRGNVTSIIFQVPELSRKRLELLREDIPGATHVVIFWNSKGQLAPQLVREAEIAAQALRLQLRPVELTTPDEIEAAFAAATQRRMA